MMRLTIKAALTLLATAVLAACNTEPRVEDVPPASELPASESPVLEPKPKLGLMTSLPLYWPIDADFGALASGTADVPAQRGAFEKTHELVLLDTLSPIAGTTPDAPETDPLATLDHLAVIQPRVLTPSDNVALDDWVREGGQLLLVLDPLLNGHYPLPLGDPRRPVEAALIPPVLARWGLELRFDEAQDRSGRTFTLGNGAIPLALSGELREMAGSDSDCDFLGSGALAKCKIGKGQITVLADAEAFKAGEALHQHPGNDDDTHAGPKDSHAIQSLVGFAFESE